ncbi:TIGR03086 family metal-binding protein [Janibacter sp. GS2]|uniref:TIGR03086 family metal-binding protein n=1 Tax=Janibacter sp. GS2 TaxID=3442646 RepID=UPI003EB6E876
MDQVPDLRPDLAAAQSWVAGLIAAVRPDQLGRPTPCREYDVRGLLEHVSTLPGKVTAVAEGNDPRALPSQAPIDPVTVAENYRTAARSAGDDWADDALLTTTLTAPWGPAPGGLVVGGFVMETIAHGWDLAVATGQDPEADPGLVATARVVAEQALTDAHRGPGMPFGPRVDPPAGAGPTTQLAAFLGRSWSPA